MPKISAQFGCNECGTIFEREMLDAPSEEVFDAEWDRIFADHESVCDEAKFRKDIFVRMEVDGEWQSVAINFEEWKQYLQEQGEEYRWPVRVKTEFL